MALIKCAECGKEFSGESKKCVHCGSTKHRSFYQKHPVVSFFLGLFALAVVFNVLGISNKNGSSESTSAPAVSNLNSNTKSNYNNQENNQITLNVSKVEAGNYNSISKSYGSVSLRIDVDNKTGKTIKGLLADLIIYDAFDQKVGVFEFKHDVDIPAGSSFVDVSYKLNLFKNGDQNITDVNKFRTQYKIIKVIY